MLAVTAALSVSEQIKDAGAYAGLASILGLAVLSLLYFGQARELKRLRDWAGRAPERTAELQEQANATAAAQAQRQTAAAALSARSPANTPVTAAGGAGRPLGATAAVTAAGVPVATSSGAPASTPAPAPASVAPASAPAVAPVASAPAAPPAAANGVSAGQETQAIPAVRPAHPAAPVAVAPELPRRPRGRVLSIAAGVLAVLAIAAGLGTQHGGDDQVSDATRTDATQTDNQIVEPPGSTSTAATPPVVPADYTVFVLNGTRQNGIAAEVGKTLETKRYVIAGKGNAIGDTEATTQVFFGEGQKRGATAVAKQLEVTAANVKTLPPEVAARARDSAGKSADVVVQIGADKATP